MAENLDDGSFFDGNYQYYSFLIVDVDEGLVNINDKKNKNRVIVNQSTAMSRLDKRKGSTSNQAYLPSNMRLGSSPSSCTTNSLYMF